MKPTVSKMVSDKLKYSDSVEAATKQYGEQLANKVTRLLWKDEPPPIGLVALINAMLLLLQLAAGRLREADEAHGDELGDDDPIRAARDEARDTLFALLGRAQSSIIGAYGEAYASNVALIGAFQRRPDLLMRRARRVVRQMRKRPTPTAILEEVTVNIEGLANRIAAGADELDARLKDVTREEKEAGATLIARDQAAEHWERVVRLVANLMVGLAEVAGEFAIAARIRPTVRRLRGEIDGDTDIVEDDDDDQDADLDPLVTDPNQGPTEG